MDTITLYDAEAAWMGGAMAEPAGGTASGTEISERSRELVLPGELPREPSHAEPSHVLDASPSKAPGRTTGLSDPAAPYRDALRASSSSASHASDAESQPPPAAERGVALPGDRGRRSHSPEPQRPSFWRRIALGGRRADPDEETQVARAMPQTQPQTQTPMSPANVEQRIVEPMLQALVSIEAKLERSHVDLSKRSDQVEQRLTQLWDIEDQLGTLSELQESLLQVSEQQRRLESAIESQTRTLRWLIGGICVSLAGAAFVVAAVLR